MKVKVHLDCIPCFLRQAVGTARDLGLDDDLTRALLRRTLEMTSALDWSVPPPLMGRDIHRLIREMTGLADPYLDRKVAATEKALALLPEMEARVEGSSDPFTTAVRIAIAGNAIDLGAKFGEKIDERRVFEEAIDAPLDPDAISALCDAVEAASDILFLADNAGEIVFDRPLLELIGRDKVTVAVRGSPTVNDATMDDAARSGLDGRFEVVDNGNDAPGTWLPDCSPDFVNRFESASLIVSKGQGNYETLNGRRDGVFFLFLVKCATVSFMTGKPEGTYVVTTGG